MLEPDPKNYGFASGLLFSANHLHLCGRSQGNSGNQESSLSYGKPSLTILNLREFRR